LTFQYNLKNQRSFVNKTQLNINVYCTFKNHVHPKITTNHSSDIGCGDFLQGASRGLIIAALNHGVEDFLIVRMDNSVKFISL
ncbi:MAG: hypothetical protein QM539_10010, partial [Alphaproteobacteria bacterium]|nr:hypothetical protein [Alphaproteobacteria bacterium]